MPIYSHCANMYKILLASKENSTKVIRKAKKTGLHHNIMGINTQNSPFNPYSSGHHQLLTTLSSCLPIIIIV